MQKKCEICGKMFEARQDHFKICYECHLKEQPGQKNQKCPENMLLKSYFDENGNPLKEIFIELPDKIAKLFNRENLKIKQLRDFYSIISGARTKALLKGIEQARPILWQCISKLEYQLKREVIPQSFVDFMKHHIELAQKDGKNLDAFYQHLDSIVCYFPR